MKANRPFRRADAAVAPVMGTVVLIAIVVLTAIAVYVISRRVGGDADREDFVHIGAEDAPATLSGGTDDQVAVLENRGGSTVDVSEYLFRVEGLPMEVKTHDGTACTASPAGLWDPGTKVCLVEGDSNVPPGRLEVEVIFLAKSTIVFEGHVDVA